MTQVHHDRFHVPHDKLHEVFRRRICELYFEGCYKNAGDDECARCPHFSVCEKMVRDALGYVGLTSEDSQKGKAA